jgi:hypothetical protein
LADLGIAARGRRALGRSRRPRSPGRWGQWLAAPERRRHVGYCISILCHAILLLFLVHWMMAAKRQPVIQAEAVAAAPTEDLDADGPIIEPPSADGTAEAELEDGEDGADRPPTIEPAVAGGLGAPRFPRLEPAPPLPRAVERSGPAAGLPMRSATSGPGVLPAGVVPEAAAGAGPDWLLAADTPVEGKLGRRSPSGRSEGVHYGGGTPQCEEAVQRGLHWLVAHQRDDGSWHFNHMTDACLHYCTHPGSDASTTAATAMALLPLLGAGYTQRQGEYQDVVQRGLDYLRKRGVTIPYGFDLRDGSMYGHAMATIALCEAYAMTQDEALREPAQGGLRFIEYAQDSKGGGWRYNPGEPGDTTVTGWMLAALKSGQMARLQVSTPAIFLAERFLSSVQNEDGSTYGYMTRQPRKTTSAVGLLCRMYTGWRRDHAGLGHGVANLAQWGPAKDDIYYDYYATQVMFHYAGPQWDAWNQKMREFVLSSQDRGGGHQSGSWYIEGHHSEEGGRLYCTSMAVMILEVYYRYMPLYSENAVKGGF